ncbi:MAG: hypothetical protein JW822_06080 [Spirochaetales bacterium]|nr:hypothetical protein [Spirochaetales bacterium]
MNLNKITVDIRNRSKWEAMDLGIILIRKFYRPIYIAWLVVTFPIMIALCVIFQGYSWIPILILWWLKPFFDRFPLYFSSRIFFGETPRFKQAIKQLPGFVFNNLLFDLTILRFSPWRSLLMPAKRLEGLKFKQRTKRIAVLSKTVRGWAALLTVVCLVFEVGLFLSWYFFLYILFMTSIIVPADIFRQTEFWKYCLQVFLYYLSLSIIEPFYVAGGFALYINRRIFLEGWDIELVFRHMKSRLSLVKEEEQVTRK